MGISILRFTVFRFPVFLFIFFIFVRTYSRNSSPEKRLQVAYCVWVLNE